MNLVTSGDLLPNLARGGRSVPASRAGTHLGWIEIRVQSAVYVPVSPSLTFAEAANDARVHPMAGSGRPLDRRHPDPESSRVRREHHDRRGAAGSRPVPQHAALTATGRPSSGAHAARISW